MNTLPGVATALALILAGLWRLLGYRFTPEQPFAFPVITGFVEWFWFCAATIAAALLLRRVWHCPERTHRVARALLPSALVSAVILLRDRLAVSLSGFDAVAFCVACGGTTMLLGRDWKFASGDRPARLLVWVVGGFAAALFAYYVAQQLYYWRNLALGYADCGENTRLLFNTVNNPRELFLRVNPDKPLFYDHFQPGVMLFAPLWLLWPHFSLTILLQVATVVGSVLPLYWIGKRLFQNTTDASLLAAVWLVYPIGSLFIYSASYGFRWGNMCLVLDFVALACWLHGRHRWALAIAVWTILLKEEAAIVIGMFGVYLSIFERRRRLGIALAAGAFGAFFLATSVIVPAMNPDGYTMRRFFHQLGDTNWQILLSPLARPTLFWGRLLASSSLYFVVMLLGPVLFIPVRKPSILFVGSLVLVFDCLNPILKNVTFHYLLGLLPVIFWALAALQREMDSETRRATLTGVVVASAAFSLFFGNAPWSKDSITIPLTPDRLSLIKDATAAIAPTDSVFITQRAGAHLVNQRYLYLDPPVPGNIDHALIDLRDNWRDLGTLGWLQRLRAIQSEVEANPALRLVKSQDGLLLYSRRGEPLDARSAVESKVLPLNAVRQNIPLVPGIQLLATTVATRPGNTRDLLAVIEVTTFCSVERATNVDLAVRCQIRYVVSATEANTYATKFQPLGQGIWPIRNWMPGRLYRDQFLFPAARELADKPSTVQFDAATLSP